MNNCNPRGSLRRDITAVTEDGANEPHCEPEYRDNARDRFDSSRVRDDDSKDSRSRHTSAENLTDGGVKRAKSCDEDTDAANHHEQDDLHLKTDENSRLHLNNRDTDHPRDIPCYKKCFNSRKDNPVEIPRLILNTDVSVPKFDTLVPPKSRLPFSPKTYRKY